MNTREKMERCKAHVDARSGLLYYKVWTSGSSVNYMYEKDAKWCLENGRCWVTKEEAGAKRGSVSPHPYTLYKPGSVVTPEKARSIIRDMPAKPGIKPELKGAYAGVAMFLLVVTALWYFLLGRIRRR